jgi:hypothetical protein
MRKKLTFILVILSMLALTITSAFTTPRVTQVSLLSVTFKEEKGVTFRFLMDGDFKKANLKGNVVIDGKTRKLYCNYGGDPAPVVVICTAPGGTAKSAGRPGVVNVAGRSFYFVVPARLPGL